MKIWKIALLMSDMKAAEELYVGQLGLKVVDRLDVGEAGECLILDAGPVKLELIPKAVFEGADGLDQPGIHHLSFASDNVEADANALRDRGMKVTREPFQPLDGMTLAFLDGLDSVNLQLFHSE
jgi:catechol 2,3-dioxygenase-like lactoylglutathione lyase family enzyme